MTQVLERETGIDRPFADIEIAPKPKVRVSPGSLLGVFLIAVAVVAAASLAISRVDGPDPAITPMQAAEARATAMGEVLESQWLANPLNIAQARAQAQAHTLENQWAANPLNIAQARAQAQAHTLENQWAALNEQE